MRYLPPRSSVGSIYLGEVLRTVRSIQKKNDRERPIRWHMNGQALLGMIWLSFSLDHFVGWLVASRNPPHLLPLFHHQFATMPEPTSPYSVPVPVPVLYQYQMMVGNVVAFVRQSDPVDKYRALCDTELCTEVRLRYYCSRYLRGGWGVPKMVMWGSQDQEISPSKWEHRDIAGSSLNLEYFTMKINQHIVTWSYGSEIARINLRKKIEFFERSSQDVSRSHEFWNALEMSWDHVNFEMLSRCLEITWILKWSRDVSR
jgi:hypothetical protein